MNKKRRNLILLLAVTALLGGMLWWVMRSGSGDGAEDPEAHEHIHTASDSDHAYDTGTLFSESADDLKQVVFRNEYGQYTAYLDKEKGEIACKELAGLPVNNAFLEYVWYGVTDMTYSDIVTTTDAEGYSAKAFGLDKPSLTVTATFAGGKKYTFTAGSKVPGHDSDEVYYTLLKGDKHVYACPIDIPFFMGDSYFLNDDIFYEYDEGIESSDIQIGDITLSGNAFDGKFVMKVNREANLSSPDYGYDYVVTSPIHWPVKRSASSELVYDLTYLMADDVVQRNPTKKQLASYGLDRPSLTVSFRRNGKSCVLYASKYDKETLYVMLKGGKIVYLLKPASLSILHELSPENLYSLSELSVQTEAVSGVTVTAAQGTTRIDVTRSKNEKSMAESDVIYTYTVEANGEAIKYTVYTNFIKQLNGSVIQRWNVEDFTAQGEPDVTVKIAWFDNYGRKADTVKFYRCNDREYAAVWGDKPVNTVSATWLNRLLQSAAQL